MIIIGGGPAGTSAALALAALGYQSCLVERQRFPRFRIGESLPPKVGPLLELLDLRDRIDAAGFVRMSGTTTSRGDTPERHLFSADGQAHGHQVDRATFDDLLLDACRARGVHVVNGRVERLLVRGERVTGVALQDLEAGGPRTLEAPFVLDASGGQRVIARRFGLTRRSAEKTVALYARWSSPTAPRDCPAEDTLFEMLEDGWLWSVLLPDDTRSVTVGVDVARLRAQPASALYHELIGRSRLLAGVLTSARLVAEPRAHDATWYDASRYAGPGYLLLGDAGFFADPLTSQGVFKAIQGGLVAASVVHTSFEHPSEAELATTYFDHSQQRFSAEYAELARSFYEQSGFEERSFWRNRAKVGPDDQLGLHRMTRRVREDRRRAWAEALRRVGGDRLQLRAKPALVVELRPISAGGLIRPRPCFVDRDRPAALGVIDVPPAIEAEVLHHLLDGRTVAGCFEAYAAQTHAPVSSDTARGLMEALSRLAEEGLIELVASV